MASLSRARLVEAYSDFALALVCVLGVGVVTALLVADLSGRKPRAPGAVQVATLAVSSAEVRRRSTESLVWELVRSGEPLYHRDSIFVPPRSDAVILLSDGSRLDLDENSLVILEAPAADQAQVELARGTVSGQAGGSGLTVRTAGGRARVGTGAIARVELSGRSERTQVDALAGTVAVEAGNAAGTLSAGQGTTVSKGGIAKAKSYSARLESPGANERLYFSGSPQPLTLRWQGAAETRVVVAADRGFKQVLASGSGGSHRFVPPAAGVYYWRVMAAREAASPTAKFALVEDVPPILTSPLPREIVSAPPGRAIPFAWTPVAGVRGYGFELAVDAAFKDLRVTEMVSASKLWLRHELPEAVYFWRVRSNDKERGASPYSQAASFRLITRPLLDAPQLLDAELEVR